MANSEFSLIQSQLFATEVTGVVKNRLENVTPVEQ